MREKKDFVVLGLRESKGKEIVNVIFCLVDKLMGMEKQGRELFERDHEHFLLHLTF